MYDLDFCPCGNISWLGRAMLGKDGNWFVEPVCGECRAGISSNNRRNGVEGVAGPLLPLNQADKDAWEMNSRVQENVPSDSACDDHVVASQYG